MADDKDGGQMKVVQGNFSQENSFTNVDLFDRIQTSLDTLRTTVTPAKDSKFLLILDNGGDINISSDLSNDNLNFILDTVKFNLILSALA
jgi:hypothetical protein